MDEVILFINGARRLARTFAIILAKECIKLMGLKSPIKLAPSFSVKGQCLPSLVVPDLWNAFAALTMSFFIISQHSLKKNPVNPSKPGAF